MYSQHLKNSTGLGETVTVLAAVGTVLTLVVATVYGRAGSDGDAGFSTILDDNVAVEAGVPEAVEPVSMSEKTVVPADMPIEELFSSESKMNALNAVLKKWGIKDPVLPEENFKSMKAAVRSRGMRLFAGVMDHNRLRSVDYPAILEIKNDDGRIGFVSVVGVWGKNFIADQTGRKTVNKEWVLEHWTRRVFIPWKDYEALPEWLHRGSKGQAVMWLQSSMNRLGFADIAPVTNTFGRKTQRAVIRFQVDNQLTASGSVGPITKMFLYRRLPGYSTPGLS